MEQFQQTAGIQLMRLDSHGTQARFMARLPDQRQFQLSEKAFYLLDCLEQPQSLDGLAGLLQQRHQLSLSAAQLLHLLKTMLLPRQLVEQHGGATTPAPSAPPPAASDALVALRLRRDLIPAAWLAPFTQRLQILFRLPLALPALLAIVLAHVGAYRQLFAQPALAPALLPLLYALFLLTVFIHELGHLAACRRWGCAHGALGAGMYMLSPVLYVDVSAAWQLERRQRVVVNAGGLYFQLLCSVPALLAFYLTRSPLWLWLIGLIDSALLINLNPLAKFDGYWMLSDGLGLPNLHRRGREISSYGLGWLAWRSGLRAERPTLPLFLRQLSRRVLIGLSCYGVVLSLALSGFVLIIVPLLVGLLAAMPGTLVASSRALIAALQAGAGAEIFKHLLLIVWNCFVGINSLWLLRNAARMVVSSGRAMVGSLRSLPREEGAMRRWPIFASGSVLGFLLGLVVAGAALFIVRPDLSAHPPGGLSAGTAAPAFSATTLAGDSVQLADFQGRPVVVTFWSPDCAHCREEIPALKAAYAALAPDVAFVSIGLGTPEAISAISASEDITYPVLLDPNGHIATNYAINGVPFTFIIAADGTIASTRPGTLQPGELEAQVAPLRLCQVDAACSVAP